VPDTTERLERFSTMTPTLRARREIFFFLRRLAQLGVAIVALLVLGTLGFMVTEGVSVWDGFTWTLDTVATVGSVPAPEDDGAQAVKVVLIVLGVGTLFYSLVTLTEFFVAGHLSGLLETRRTQRMIDSLSNHLVICGFGRVGRQVAHDLRAANARYVVVDDNPENRELAQTAGIHFIEGSPSEDEVLRQAGIERARAVLACVDSDAENIFITLSARQMRDQIFIVARAAVEDSEKKLKRAGADRVISPYKASGNEMARLALHPQASGVVDVAPEYLMEEIGVADGCPACGQTVGDIRGGAIVVAVRRGNGTFHFQPPPEHVLSEGDVVVAMGTARTVDRLERLLAPDT
jgi:voltage-gated potassium channel